MRPILASQVILTADQSHLETSQGLQLLFGQMKKWLASIEYLNNSVKPQ